MNQIKLRPYQDQAINEIEYELSSGNTSMVLFAWTAWGKSVAIGQLVKNIQQTLRDGENILISVTVKVLFEQLKETLTNFGIEFDLIHADDKDMDFKHNVKLSMAQTLHSRLDDINFDVEYMFQDEAHVEWNTTRTKAIMNACKVQVRIGFTATPYTGPGYALENNPIIINTATPDELEDAGYITPVKFYTAKFFQGKNIENELDKGNNGDFTEPSLEKVFNTEEMVEEAVLAMNEINAREKKTIVFATSIAHADALAEEMRKNGYEAYSYHSKMKKADEDRLMNWFRSSENVSLKDYGEKDLFGTEPQKIKGKAICAVGRIQIGFDVPDVELGVFARAVGSPGLYRQMVGRLVRLAEGKEYAEMLDLGQNIQRLGFPNEVFTPVDKTSPTKKQELSNEQARHEIVEMAGIEFNGEIEEITKAKIQLIRDRIEANKRKNLWEVDGNSIGMMFEVANDPETIVAIGYEIDRRVRGARMDYTPKNIKWASENFISMVNDFPEYRTKIINSHKTRIKNIVKGKKKIASIHYFANWLREQTPYIYKNMLEEEQEKQEEQKEEKHRYYVPEIEIDEDEIPF